MNVFAPRTKNEVFRFSDLAPGILELRKYSSSAVVAVLRKIGNRVRHRRKRISLAKSDQRLRAGLDVQELSGRFPSDAKRILVLCKGNICRSPFADKYLAQASAQKKLGLEFVSAGLAAELDKDAYPLARTVARDFGVDLDGHRTQLLSHEMVEAADIILVMEPEQETQLERRFPEALRKTFLLGHFAKEAPSTEIADPYGGTAQDFAECYTFMVSACDGFLSRFE
jgi:protein-tyrosine-phosphatase